MCGEDGQGLERQILVNAIEFTIGQRLVRRLCPHCKQETKLVPADLKRVQEELAKIKNPNVQIPKQLIFYHSVGCEKCGHIGYKGRLGLYETITMSPAIQKLIQKENVTDFEIEQTAIAEGTVTIVQDGILKALAGETSIEEVFRVI